MSGLPDLARAAGRRARTLRGYPRLRRAVYRAMRSETGGRVLGRAARWGGLPLPEPDETGPDHPAPGRRMAALGVTGLPTLLVDLTAVPDDRVAAVLDEVAVWQELTAALRPVVLVRPTGLGAVRVHGWVAEIVPDAAEWGRDEQEAQEVLAERVGSMTMTYRARGLLQVGPEGLTTAQRAFLSHLVPAGPVS